MKSLVGLILLAFVEKSFAIEPTIIVHGGAGSIPESRVGFKKQLL